MGHRLRLPDAFEVPTQVNGWTRDPEPYNGEAWFGPDREQSVVAFNSLETVYAEVRDERCSGFETGERIFERELEQPETETVPEMRERVRSANAALVEDLAAWMRANPPGQWSRTRVREAVFEAPVGYELADYYIESRQSRVVYHRVGAEAPSRLAGIGKPETVDPETFPYLVVEVWAGSGNATVALAPWRHAHDHEMQEVVETPDECGLDIALSMARQYAREQVDDSGTETTVGQTDLGQFASAGGD